MERGQRLRYVVPVVLLVVIAGVAFWVTARARGDCPVSTPELDSAATALVPVTGLVPSGTVGQERGPVVAAVNGLGGPFGPVLSGRFYDREEMPAPLGVGSDLGLATSQSVQVVSLPHGTVRWTRGYDAPRAAGGLVGENFVLLAGGHQPAVASFDATDGTASGCVVAPSAATSVNAEGAQTLLTDQAGSDVVTAVGPPGGTVTLARVDPAGEVRWQRRLDVDTAGSVTVAGDLVLVSRLGHDPVGRAEEAVGGTSRVAVSAYSLADGSRAWTYRPQSGASASLVDWDAETGHVLVMESTARAGAQPDRSVASLVALDPDGHRLWHRAVGTGYWDATLWGPSVVAQGPDPAGGTQLEAFSTRTGSLAWRLPARQAPPRGPHPRTNFGDAVQVHDWFVVPSPNGLLDVDPVTGRFDRLDSDVAIQQVLPLGKYAVIRTAQALLVTGIKG